MTRPRCRAGAETPATGWSGPGKPRRRLRRPALRIAARPGPRRRLHGAGRELALGRLLGGEPCVQLGEVLVHAPLAERARRARGERVRLRTAAVMLSLRTLLGHG